MEPFETRMRQGGDAAVREAGRFFMKSGSVHRSLEKITTHLERLGIPSAVAGGMALVAHGYDRTTEDVVILLNPEGLRSVHQSLDGLGYVPPFTGSKNLRDVETGVRVEFLVAGQYPGDGKPKPVAFPDPARAAKDIDRIQYIRLDNLIELKLASGMTNAGRLNDLADVQELIRLLRLGREFGEKLDPYVRGKFVELWEGVEQNSGADGEQ